MSAQILFVTGKGGVGKSTVAAALALKKAQSGLKTLLVEIGDQSFYKDFFHLPKVGYTPTVLQENLSVALWTGQDCLREYIVHLIKVEALYKLFFENAVMKAFINVAPALPELAIMGKAPSGPRKHGPKLAYDCLVIDAYATGHFMALVGAATGMAQAVKFGPMGEQSRGIDKVLRDPKLCEYYLVCLPEELPVKETEELYAELESKFEITPHIVLNKCFETAKGQTIAASEFKAAESSASDEFQQFAKEHKQNIALHAEMKKRLEKLSENVSVLPPVWDHETKNLLAELASRLP
ncbi:MAG: arsenical pump-driving ATPase [Proteobacteria bacterium]|nr:MAG: arsenical pump-driving ATPase [Pseudomonadota bacterium]